MRYKCIPCDHEFEVKKGVKPRCPRCLKIHDLEPIPESSAEKGRPSKRSLVVPGILVAVAAIVGVAYFAVKKNLKEVQSTETVVDSRSLFDKLSIPKEDAVDPCEATAAVAQFAAGISKDASDQEAMNRLFQGVMQLKDQKRWKPFSQREPRGERPLSAAKLVERLENAKASEPWRAVSYELSCLLFAMAKSQNLDVRMVEIKSFNDEKQPADPDGKLGRYGVAFGPFEKGREAPLYDLWSGRSRTSAKADAEVLGPAETMAPYFAIGALSLLVSQDMSNALKLNDIAIKLDPKSPHFRAGRGFIFAATGVPEESVIEFEKALKLRESAVQRVNLAEILMVMNPMDKRAETGIDAALNEMPNFARAHALKAMTHLMRQEVQEAETELSLAERLDPESPSIALYWSRFYAAKSDSEQAVAKAKDAVRLSEESVSSLLALAGIYREVARFSEMRQTLDQVYAKMDNPSMSSKIKEIFGYDPDAKAEEPPSAPSDSVDQGFAGIKEPQQDRKLELGDSLGKGTGGPRLGGGDSDRFKLDMKLK